MKYLHFEDFNLKDKKVLLRLDLNVPIKDQVITDDTRIKQALPTLEKILTQTNKLVVMSHLGRPQGQANPKYSLEAVGTYLSEALDKEVVFVNDYTKEPVSQILNQISDNQFILLENLRFHHGEVQNEPIFSQTLAKNIDIYINDAFGTVHRRHSSIFGVPSLFPKESKAVGFLIRKEIESLDKLKNNKQAPFTVVIGGAKVTDKIGAILSLLEHCNNLLIGGAMSFPFLKYKGFSIGKAKVDQQSLDHVATIFRNAENRKISIELPDDHVCTESFDQHAPSQILDSDSLLSSSIGLDIGPKTINKYQEIIEGSKTIFWNGPMGVFEWDAFNKGTLAISESIARCHGYTVVGGGDSIAALRKSGYMDKIDHVSTGGGASLEYLEGKSLPGLIALSQ